MTVIGEVKLVPHGIEDFKRSLEIEWRVLNFSSLSDYFYYSPSFSFIGKSFRLKIVPNDNPSVPSVGYIALYLYCEGASTVSPTTLEYSLGLKTFSNRKLVEHYCMHSFTNERPFYGVHRMYFRSDIFLKKDIFKPANSLTVFCNLKYPKSAEIAENEKLVSDFKEILMNGDLSDILINVKGKEFRLHKTILAARNPYFHAMFKNDMKEKISGVVSIDDCEPHIFSSFIHFLYTGNVEKLSSENMCDLYEIANKYQEEQLKKKCFDFMLNSMSVDNLCDVIKLALRFEDSILLQEATKYFGGKTKEVIRSMKWQAFLLECPIQANELLIKALDYSDNK